MVRVGAPTGMSQLPSNRGKSLTTWNIRHGGGSAARCLAIGDQLAEFGSDVLVVTEFRDNAAGHRIKSALTTLRYQLSHPPVPAGANSVLVATREAIRASYPLDVTLPDQRHLWVVELDWMRLCGVYMPLGHAKLPYWQALQHAANGTRGIDLFLGDFNTGNNSIDLEEGATPFISSELFDSFGTSTVRDVWRIRNPDTREYSWLSPQAKKGFRLDHAFARASLLDYVRDCAYYHEPRLKKVSDHSALTIAFDFPAKRTWERSSL